MQSRSRPASATHPSAPSYHYLIVGAGRQGTAAAYDLACFGEAARIALADRDPSAAGRAAERVNRLSKARLAAPLTLDVREEGAVEEAVRGMDVVLSAVPYYFNLPITRAAVAAGAHYCDLGGNTEIVRAQMALDAEARRAGVSIVPDCGMGPGLVNTLGAYVIQLLAEQMSAEPREVHVYDAGLPQRPVPPWNYQLTFHVNGLTNEYDGDATFIRDGRLLQVPTFTELETLDIPPLGKLEAFVISGNLSTTPHTHLGKLERYGAKVLRYPGHFATFEAYKRLGLFSEGAVDVDGQPVVPRHLYHRLLEPKITPRNVRDVCVMRAVGVGEKDGRPARVTVDLVDRYDEATGFTAMERLTGWHGAIMMGFQARGRIAPGAHRMEQTVKASEVMAELERRGIPHTVRWE